jgi:dinuclear metal center YbgI/SA1388 family protein
MLDPKYFANSRSQDARNSSSKLAAVAHVSNLQSKPEKRIGSLTFTMPSITDIVRYTDNYLHIGEMEDWPNAVNGLQVENSGRVTRIGAAVDASTRVLTAAARKDIDLVIVHHGLFWPGLQSVTGALHRQLKIAFENDIALYSAHLPLDVHPKVGNNAQLAAVLGLKLAKPFLEEKGHPIGLKTRAALPRNELVRKLRKVLGGPLKAFNFGPKQTHAIGIVTGGAGSEIYRVAEEGIDTFITGEAPHWAAVAAEELGINLLLGGHYATETFGVKALAAQLSAKFLVPWEFIDRPSRL